MNVVVLRRRLFYICAMVLLLVPLYFLGNPSVRNADGSVKSAGGTLAQIRTNYDLGQGDLGEIDPASESMRLATLGLRGVASTILWQKAEYYKKEKFWDRLSATLNQIAVLQPHFMEVWEYQAHNLSYNVSVEFDDYRQRYQWVKRGIDYLIKGGKFNKRRTELPFEMGNFFGSKMGVADEKLQYRALYRDDENYHAEVLEKTGLDLDQPEGLGADRKPDNWLSGRLWFEKAYAMVEAGSPQARSTLMFYVKSPQWLMKSAEAMQTEGTLDEPARYAWRRAGREWELFGKRNIVTTFGDTIYLTELRTASENYDKLKKEFQVFAGEAYAKLLAERTAQLLPEEIAAREKDPLERSFNEMVMADKVEMISDVPPMEIARATSEDKRIEALEFAQRLEAAREKISHVDMYRSQVNYTYWEARCVAEQEDASILARTSMYQANELLDRGELDAAIAKFDEAWIAWDQLFNKFPAMMVDDISDEVMVSIESYLRLTDQPDLPEDFVLNGFIKFKDMHESSNPENYQSAQGVMNVISSWTQLYPDRNFLEEYFRRADSTPAPTESQEASQETPEAATENTTGDAPASSEEGTVEEAATDTEAMPPDAATDAPPVAHDAAQTEPSVPPLTIEPPEEGTAPSPKS